MIGHPNAHTFAFVLFLRRELKAFSPFGKGEIRGIFSDHLCLTHSVYPTYFTGYMYGKVGGWRKFYCCHGEGSATGRGNLVLLFVVILNYGSERAQEPDAIGRMQQCHYSTVIL